MRLNYRGNGSGTAIGGCISILATIAALFYVTYDFFEAKDNPEYLGTPSIYSGDAEGFQLNGDQHIAFLFLPMNMHNPTKLTKDQVHGMFRLIIKDDTDGREVDSSSYFAGVNCDWVCENRWNKTQEECNAIRDSM